MPQVLNWKSISGGIPKGAKYVGRGSKWGNPFYIGRDGDRHTVVEKYRNHLRHSPDLLASLEEIRGKDLVCYCAPEECHADILLELANG